jgi:hypothetical protein
MSKSRWLAAAALAALAGTASLPAGLAKPPDLPVDDRISCPDGSEQSPHDPVADRADTPRSAGQLFEAAEASRRSGNREAARIGYEEVHLLDPTSWLGRLAIERLKELDAPGSTGEEPSEPDNPPAPSSQSQPGPVSTPGGTAQPEREQEHERRIRATTQPLGTVDVDTY